MHLRSAAVAQALSISSIHHSALSTRCYSILGQGAAVAYII